MNRVRSSVFVIVFLGSICSIECAQVHSETEKMQKMLFDGARFAIFKTIEKALSNPGVDINAKNKNGETALTLLANNLDPRNRDNVKKIVIYLLEHGSDWTQDYRATYEYNGAFKEAVDLYFSDLERLYKSKLKSSALENTSFCETLCVLVSEYAYENPELEKKIRKEKEIEMEYSGLLFESF